MAGPSTQVVVQRQLDEPALAQVLALIDAATSADGVRPLNEHVMLHLRHGGDADTRHLLAHDEAGRLVGYAHLDVTDTVAGPSAELVVHPVHRGRGHGRALTAASASTASEQGRGPLRLWSHGAHPSAQVMAEHSGFTRVRSLWQMRRSLYAPIPDVPFPADVTARTFQPGRDEPAWLALNARAFADHPEQGAWTADDLARREAEAWFDPQGFFLAERREPGGSRLVGFHWTKVHGGRERSGHRHGGREHGQQHPHGHEPIGEVYVLGVDPAERGTGIGHALTVLGLCHLRSQGLGEVMLYVDEDAKDAIRLYESLGFTHWDTDVMYAQDR